MSDDIDISSGGAIAVDTHRLRAGADGYRNVADRLDDLSGTAWRNAVRLSAAEGPLAHDSGRAWAIAWRLRSATDAAALLAQRLSHAATVYELVDLDVARRATTDVGEIAGITARIARLTLDDPLAAAEAALVEVDWKAGDALTEAAQGEMTLGAVSPELGSLAGDAILAVGLAAAVSGSGIIQSDSRLAGTAEPFELRRVGAGSTSFPPPGSLADAVSRMPQDDARLRVERYTMPDGTNRFALYVAGTDFAGGKREAFDMAANVELYAGHDAASFEATKSALAEAGAKPGDRVYMFGHSQGGMIAGHLAIEGAYDTRLLTTFGSPTEAQAGPSTLSVQLKHNEPVDMLAGGGSASRVGAPDSIVVHRTVGFLPSLDGPLPAHQLTSYSETAAMLDRSDDPRVGALQERLGELRGAVRVESFDYAVDRTDVN